MSVGAAIAKGVDTGAEETVFGPRDDFRRDLDLLCGERNSLIRLIEMNVWGNALILQHEDAFDDACEARGAFKMANLKIE